MQANTINIRQTVAEIIPTFSEIYIIRSAKYGIV